MRFPWNNERAGNVAAYAFLHTIDVEKNYYYIF
jgi:hypothetical protein